MTLRRPRRSHVVAYIAVVLTALSACTLTTALDGLSGGTPDAGAAPIDASAPADTAAGPSGGDAAAADAADGGDTRRFCLRQSPAPTFCDDFDVGASLLATWSAFDVGGDASVVIDLDAFVSPPGSLVARVPPIAGSATVAANVQRTFAGVTANFVRLSFRVRLDTVGQPPGYAPFGQFDLEPPSGGPPLEVRLVAHAEGYTDLDTAVPLDGGAFTYPSTHLARNLVPNVWALVEMQVDLGKPPKASVWLDGEPAVQDWPLDPAFRPGVITVVGGLFYGAGPAATGWELHEDDFIVDLRSP